MSNQIITTVEIDANIDKFQSKMQSIKESYSETVSSIKADSIDSPLVSDESQDSVMSSYTYLFKNLNEANRVFGEIKKNASSIPDSLQQSMLPLFQGLDRTFQNITGYIDTAGKKMSSSFDLKTYNNQIRFAAQSINQYMSDIQTFTAIATGKNGLGAVTKELGQLFQGSNFKQLQSLVDPILVKNQLTDNSRKSDVQLISSILSGGMKDYSPVTELLAQMGVTSRLAQENALKMALATTNNRHLRRDVTTGFRRYSGMTAIDEPVIVTDNAPDRYKASYLSGGRIIKSDKPTPKLPASNRATEEEFYRAIRDEIESGNSVAFEAAIKSGLVRQVNGGKYKYIDIADANGALLDQFGGYVAQKARRASQGAPQYIRRFDDFDYQSAIVRNDSKRNREAQTLMWLDRRPDAMPYIKEGWQIPQGLRYEDEEHVTQKLNNSAMINIPRMAIQNEGGKLRFTVQTPRQNNIDPHLLDYNWRKQNGIFQDVNDEWITMGRNPLLDRIIRLTPGAKFEDWSFGYGFDEKNLPKKGAPMIIDVPLDYFREHDEHGNVKFKEEKDLKGKTQRKAYFAGDNANLIDQVNQGAVVTLSTENQGDLEYVKAVSNVTGGGSMKMIRKDVYDALIKQDKARGIIPMLSYFSETDENNLLIDPKTGKAIDPYSEEGVKQYAKYFSNQSKMLSNSVPIEELGGKTPRAAVVSFKSFYDAIEKETQQEFEKRFRFDGGALIDDRTYSKDVQARMGPAKFLAIHQDWRKFLEDAGFAYRDKEFEGDDNLHFFMAGQGTTAAQVARYKELNNRRRNLTEDELAEFRELRDRRMVDVMRDDVEMLVDETAVKSIGALSHLSPEEFLSISETLTKSNSNSAFSRLTEDQKTAIKNRSSKSNRSAVTLTADQVNELFNESGNPAYDFGFRLMKDTEGFYGKKQFWSPAYMSSVVVTPEMMKRSEANYREAIQKLSTPEGIIDYLFSGNDRDSKRVQQDSSLLYTDRGIQFKIQRAKRDLQEKSLRGYAMLPADMLVATPNPYSLWNPVGNYLTGHDAQGEAAKLKAKTGTIITQRGSTKDLTNATRSPYAAGSNFFATIQRRQKAAERYGLSPDAAVMNIEDLYSLNTGDFDGDFIWLYHALATDDDFKKRTEKRNRYAQQAMKSIEKERETAKDLQKMIGGETRGTRNGASFAEASNVEQETTTGGVGLGYKAGQVVGRTQDLSDEDAGIVDAYANQTYADAIDLIKHSDMQVAQASGKALDAIKTRKPIERLVQSLFSDEDNNKVGATDIFAYGLPTYIDAIATSNMRTQKMFADMDPTYGSRIREALTNNIQARFGNATQTEKDLADWYSGLVGNKMSGNFQISSNEDLQKGEQLIAKLQNAYNAEYKKDQNSEITKRMGKLLGEARSAIQQETLLGWTEGNLDDINKYYELAHWDNPIKDGTFVSESDRDVARILFQKNAQDAIAERKRAEEDQINEIIRDKTGRTGNPQRQYLLERLHTAYKHTGFNWSNASAYMEKPIDFFGLTYSDVFGGDTSHPGSEMSPEGYMRFDPKTEELQYATKQGHVSQREQIARRILTGSTIPSDIDADAFLGSAAHTFMETYGKLRKGANPLNDLEARNEAYKAFENYLFDDEHKNERDQARVSFSVENGRIVAHHADEATQKRLNAKLSYGQRRNVNGKTTYGSLDEIAQHYYGPLYEGRNHIGEGMIMSEGVMYNDNGEQLISKRTEGGNGVWLVPTQDGQLVIDMPRYKKDANGQTVERQAGLYFTPDMIKKDKNGNITIADWKSSGTGQKHAIAQMAFYATQLEELGRQYWQNGAVDKDLEWFGQFIDKDTGNSKITNIEAIDMFAQNPKQRILTWRYNQDKAQEVRDEVYNGMRRLSHSAKTGFYDELKTNVPLRDAKDKGDPNRPVYAPDEILDDVFFSDRSNVLDEKLLANLTSETNREVLQGRTGYKVGDGEFIDNDKSYLVAKFMKDQETLQQVQRFANKQSMKLHNTSFESSDAFTQNIDQLRDLFNLEQRETIDQYLKTVNTAPDVSLLSGDFDINQRKAIQTMANLSMLRKEYIDNLGKTAEYDYNSILYSKGDMLSKLQAGRRKYEQDISALRGAKNDSQFVQNGRFLTDEDEAYEYLMQNYDQSQREGETDFQWQTRIKNEEIQKRKDAKTLAASAKKAESQYDKRVAEIDNYRKSFEVGWIEELEKHKTEENFGLNQLFSGGSVESVINNLKLKSQDILNATTETDAVTGEKKIQDALLQQALITWAADIDKQAGSFASIQGTTLERVINSGASFDNKRVEAMMNGTALDPNVIRDKALYDFGATYAKINPSATQEQLNKAVETYAKTYDNSLREQQEMQAIRNDVSYNRFMRQGDQLSRNRYGGSRGIAARALAIHESALSQQENRLMTATQMRMDQERVVEQKKGTEGYDQEVAKLNELKNAEAAARTEMEQLGKHSVTAGDVFASLGQSVQALTQRLGRQVFQKALQETKRFVKEFDSSMNEIQAITLKSDTDMQAVRSQTINKALGLRTSVSNVATTEAALYRQGLSDQEVSERTDSIIKFATVTKLNVAEATKIITTALQNDLVGSATEAMDALVALGDSAATTAAEIGKGMQKAAASAKVAGVSYEELTALLTIGTSDTQLSGTQVGTALQTVFSRMRRLSLSGYTADQNGEKTTTSDAEAALKAVGVDLWDDKTTGKMRTAYEVMSDLSKVWQNLSDAQKSIVTNALAGTRQTNVFSTLMEGMSEDGGATLDKYLGLAKDSEGITQSKYEIAMQSLSASMETFRSSFDSVVASLVEAGSVTGVIDGISSLFQGLSTAAENAGSIGSGLSIITAGILGLTAAIATIVTTGSGPIGWLLGGLTAVATLVGGLHLSSVIGQIANPLSEDDKTLKEAQKKLNQNNAMSDAAQDQHKKQLDVIKEVEEAGVAWKKLNSIENENGLRDSLQNLASVFPELSGEIAKATTDLSKWKDIVLQASSISDKFLQTNKGLLSEKIRDQIQLKFKSSYNKNFEQIYEDPLAQSNALAAYNAFAGTNDPSLFSYDPGFTMLTAYRIGKGNKEVAPFTKYVEALLSKNGLDDALSYLRTNNDSDEAMPVLNQAAEFVFARMNSKPSFLGDANSSLKYHRDVINSLFYDSGVPTEIIDEYGNIDPSVYASLNSLMTTNGRLEDKPQHRKDLKYSLLSILARGSAQVQSSLQEQYPELRQHIIDNQTSVDQVPDEILDQAADWLDEFVTTQSNAGLLSARRAASTKTIHDAIQDQSSLINLYATEDFSAEAITKAIEAKVGKAVLNDKNGIYLEDGVPTQALIDLITGIFPEIEDVQGLENLIKEYSPEDYYGFKVGNNAFRAEDEAKRFVRNSYGKYRLSDIKQYKTNATVFQSTESLFDAARLKANEKNPYDTLRILQQGVVSGHTVDERNDYIARILGEGDLLYNLQNGIIDESQLPKEIRQLITRFDSEQTQTLKPIENYNDWQSFLTDLDNTELGATMQAYMATNPEMIAAYMSRNVNPKESLNTFKSAVANAKPGQFKTPDVMESVMNTITSSPEFIEELTTDKILEPFYKQMQSFFGGEEQLAAVFESITSGTYEGSDAQKAVNEALTKARIKKSLSTKQYLSSDVGSMAQQIMSGFTAGDFKDWTGAQAAFDFDEGDWSALESAYPSLKKFLDLTEAQRSTGEGQLIKQQAEIELSVTGLDTLEQAGEVLSGTKQLIEDLKKGGEFEIKAKIRLENEASEIQKNAAKITNGTYAEQVESMLAAGISAESIATNPGDSLKQGTDYWAEQRRQEAGRLTAMLQAGETEEANKTAAENGYTFVPAEDQEKVINHLRNDLGYFMGPDGTWYSSNPFDSNGKLLPFADGMISEYATQQYANLTKGYFVPGEDVGQVPYVNTAVGKSRPLSPYEINIAQRQLLYASTQEKWQNVYGSDPDLMKAASESFGEHGQNVLAMFNNPEVSPEELAKEQALAVQELNNNLRTQVDEYRNQLLSASQAENAFNNYALSPDEYASTIASFLPNRNEADVKQIMNGNDNKAKEALKKEIQDQIQTLLQTIANGLNIDIDPSDTSSAFETLSAALQGVDDKAAEAILQIAKMFDEFGNLTPTSTASALSDYASRYKSGRDSRNKLQQIIDAIDNGSVSTINTMLSENAGLFEGDTFADRKKSFEEWLSHQTQGVQDIFGEMAGRSQNQNFFTESDISNLRNESVFGRLTYNRDSEAYYKQFTGMLDAEGNLDVKAFKTAATEDADGFGEWAQSIEYVKDMLNESKDGVVQNGEALERFRVNALADALDAQNKFGDSTKRITDAMRKSKGTFEERTDLMTQYRKAIADANKYQNAMARLQGKKVSKEDESLFESLNFSKKKIEDAKKGNAEAVDEIYAALEKESQKYSTEAQDIGLGIIMSDTELQDAIQKQVQSYSDNLEDITIEGPGITVENGEVTYNGEALLSEFGSKMDEQTKQLIEEALASGGTATATVDGDGNIVNVSWSFSPNGGGGDGASGGGGGGGGGKSKAQKAIEDAKHALTELEHLQKIYDTKLKHAESVNDRVEFNSAFESQRQNYSQMAAVYRQNIEALEAQRAGMSETKDDYWSLTDAINGYKEALEELTNQIIELNKQRLDFIQQQQDVADSSQDRRKTVATAEKDYSALIEDYDTHRARVAELVNLRRESFAQNVPQLNEWRNELDRIQKEEGPNSQNAIDIMNKIADIEAEQFNLESEIIQEVRDLNALENEILQTELRRATEIPSGNSRLAQSGASLAEAQENYALQRQFLRDDNAFIEEQLAAKVAEADKFFARVNDAELKASDPDGWSEALESYISNAEEIDKLQIQLIENQRTIAESFVNEVTKGYEDATRAAKAYSESAVSIAEYFKTGEEFEKYRSSMRDAIKLTESLRESTAVQVAQLKEQLATMDEADPGYREIADALYQAEQQEIDYTKAIRDNTIAMQKNITEQIKLNAERQSIAPETYSSIAGSYGDMYKRNGQWDDYRKALQIQIDAAKQTKELDSEAAQQLYDRMTHTKGELPETGDPLREKQSRLEAERDARLAELNAQRDAEYAKLLEYQRRQNEIDKQRADLLANPPQMIVPDVEPVYEERETGEVRTVGRELTKEEAARRKTLQNQLHQLEAAMNGKGVQFDLWGTARATVRQLTAQSKQPGGENIHVPTVEDVAGSLGPALKKAQEEANKKRLSSMQEQYDKLKEQLDEIEATTKTEVAATETVNVAQVQAEEQARADYEAAMEEYNGQLETLASQESDLAASIEATNANIDSINADIDKTSSEFGSMIQYVTDEMGEAFFTEVESYMDAYQNLAELMKSDAQKAKEIFDKISEYQDITRQKVLFDINERNRAANGSINLANSYAGTYGKTSEYDLQAEAYATSYAQRATTIATLRDAANELYEEIMSHDEDNPWISEEVKDKAIKEYQNIIKQYSDEVSAAIQDRFNEEAARHTKITEDNNDTRRWIDQAMAVNQAAGAIYLNREDFENYRRLLGNNEVQLNKSIEARKKHIEALKEELDEYRDNPKLLRQTIDEINKEEIAILSDTKAIEENTKAIEANRMAQLDLATTRANLASTTNAQLANTYASMSQQAGDWEGYRGMLKAGNDANRTTYRNNKIEIDTLTQQLQNREITDPQQQSAAIQRLYQLITNNASLQATMESNERAINKSYLDETAMNVNLGTLRPNFLNDVYGQWASRYGSIGNYAAQRGALNQQLQASQQMVPVYEEAIKELKKQIAGLEEGSPEWQEATQRLYEYQAALQKLKISMEEAAEAIKKAVIDEIVKTYEDASRGPLHNIEKAGIYAGMYNSTMFYDLYQNMLETQMEDRKPVREAIQKEIESLQAELENTRGTSQYDRVVQEIYTRQNEYVRLEADDIQALIDIANSKVDSTLKARQKMIDSFDREIKVASMLSQYYSENKDSEMYTKAIERQKEAIKAKQEYEISEIDTLRELAKTTPENTDAFEKLEKQIYDSAMSVAEMDYELIKLDKQIKSMEIDEMLERMSRVDEMQNHRADMYTTVRTRYQNRDELTNVNTILASENEIQETRADTLRLFIEELEAELTTVAEGGDEYWRIASAIMKYEKELEETTNTVESNTKAMSENRKQILENRKAVEDMVDEEIRKRIQEERDMLAGTTSNQNQILEILRNSYRNRFELYERDLNKQKEALNEEKGLINERLQMRKKALEEERQTEELAELQRQLALISADSSRTKEAKELRKRIQELQQNRALSLAEDEANAQAEMLDDQIKSIDDNLDYQREKLDEYLEDANNFKETIDILLSGSFEDLMEWVKVNDETYKNSLDATRMEMTNSWEDTWKQMKGIVDTYFEQINEIMQSADSLLGYMTESTEYKNLSESGQELYIQNILDAYEKMRKGELDNADYEHFDDFVFRRILEELPEWWIDLLNNKVEGGSKIVPSTFEHDPNIAPNTFSDGSPYLGLTDNSLWMEAVTQFVENNTSATTGFIDSLKNAKDSKLYGEILGSQSTIESKTAERDKLLASVAGMDKGTEDYITTTNEINELGFQIEKETARKQALNEMFIEELTTQVNDSFANTSQAINLMKDIATDSLNDLTIAIGEEGTKEFENTLASLQENRTTLENFVNTLDADTKATVMNLYDNMTSNLDTESEMLNDMSTAVGERTGELAENVSNTASQASREISDTSKLLAGDLETITGNAAFDLNDNIDRKLVEEYKIEEAEKKTIDDASKQYSTDSQSLTTALGELKDKIEGIWGAEGTQTTAIEGLTGAEKDLTSLLNEFVKPGGTMDTYAKEINEYAALVSGYSGNVDTYLSAVSGYSGNVDTYLSAVSGYSGKIDTYLSAVTGVTVSMKNEISNFERYVDKKLTDVDAALKAGSMESFINGMYNTLLGRDADATGMSTWLNLGDKNKIVEGILGSDEFNSLHPEGADAFLSANGLTIAGLTGSATGSSTTTSGSSGKTSGSKSAAGKAKTNSNTGTATGMMYSYAWGAVWDPAANKYIAQPVDPSSPLAMSQDDARALAQAVNGEKVDAKNSFGKDNPTWTQQQIEGYQRMGKEEYTNTKNKFKAGESVTNDYAFVAYMHDNGDVEYSDNRNANSNLSKTIGKLTDYAIGSAQDLENLESVLNQKGVGVGDITHVGDGGTVTADTSKTYNVKNHNTGQTERLTIEKKYATGGLVDFTGPAWVDGTKIKPEAFLDSVDTKLIQSLTDTLRYVYVASPLMPPSDLIGNNSNTIGDVHVTINQAELKSDADFEDVARRVGQVFTKELTKQGFNLSNYAS